MMQLILQYSLLILFVIGNILAVEIIPKPNCNNNVDNRQNGRIGRHFVKHRKRCESSPDENENINNEFKSYNSPKLAKLHRTREYKTFNLHNDDIESIYVSNGEFINLTCTIQTKEIDWHFKDANLTTKILSNGLKLQLIKPINSFIDANTRSSHNGGGGVKTLKYRVSTDHNSNHVLTVYVQGREDEGSYQCIDSQSDMPVKRTIKLFLKNHSNSTRYTFTMAVLILITLIFSVL